MKHLACILFLFFAFKISLFAQHYFKGEVNDERGKPLPFVKIVVHSNGSVFYSGNNGCYNITSSQTRDSVTLILDGYDTLKTIIKSNDYATLTMKMQQLAVTSSTKLISATEGLSIQEKIAHYFGGETYQGLKENDFIGVKAHPEVGFTLNNNKAAYSNIRRLLNMGIKAPPDAVRIEEMLNYFELGYVSPGGNETFDIDSRLSSCPWNSSNQLLFLKICARTAELKNVPSGNLVFLIDVSGSMDKINRLPLLKSAFKSMAKKLRSIDTVSIVVYGGVTGVWLQPTSGSEQQKILKAIDDLAPGGGTPGEAAIIQAYTLARKKYIAGGNNRVILATDGDFNVGQTNDEALEMLITSYRNSGIYLTCLGVGMGNYKDSKLEVLAKKGNGNFAYLDSEQEAEKILVKEFTQTVYAVADDAGLKISFNPDYVSQYRLIGFDNKINTLLEPGNYLEKGEVGSGHTLMAVFEISPTVKNTNMIISANMQSAPHSSIADAMLDYKLPGSIYPNLIVHPCSMSYTVFDSLPSYYRFATSVIMFASILRQSNYIKNITWKEINNITLSAYDKNNFEQIQYLQLIQKAQKIYPKKYNRKK